MSYIETTYSKLAMVLLGLLLAGCAGPATPFGQLKFWQTSHGWSDDDHTENKDIVVLFKPGTQRFHHLNNFAIALTDKRGIPDTAKVYVYYNGKEVSDSFKVEIDKENNLLKANFKNLRLNPRTLHDITMHYRANENDNGITRRWRMPTCDFAAKKPVHHTGNFDVQPTLLSELETAALDNGINPAILAGLVAQESGFNNKAVSFAKALGMTQITHIAEEEIVDEVKGWPRYPGIRNLSFPELKYHVMRGDITPKNEWRLDPEKSFQGGGLYLKHLLKYWGYPSKRKLIADNRLELSKVVLASYNIGPTAVTRAIERKGSDWMKDSEGKSSTKYVQMVGSYCSGFTEENADAQ